MVAVALIGAIAMTAPVVAAQAPAAAGVLKVTLTAPTHTPRVGVRWSYSVRASAGGKAVVARITAQIVDPVGGVHPVQFGKGTRNITNWRFRGVFRDFVVWPASSRGVPLKFRAKVSAGAAKRTLVYAVTPRS